MKPHEAHQISKSDDEYQGYEDRRKLSCIGAASHSPFETCGIHIPNTGVSILWPRASALALAYVCARTRKLEVCTHKQVHANSDASSLLSL
ncbi:hypothetical protein MPTK1_1g19810 [Marchantia polymorpha subsp. ruderalis]|uniref:Uncharacterized protein n=2 Tax=Marchantia polymorpha TaxID=3197 RepID=A0AAF6AS21_MARPO|nr:hypothetical protein MARPO_0001s0320 [Marchantia polymorpha]BBM99241.1 hypothetical protein Mp_1g19810 [Marchantia polymorpha subsp. ruderalis]|eukprot:PTQ50324.1 hypothetical protein MARPO_0001s0320 [Marchantia polymorpha]